MRLGRHSTTAADTFQRWTVRHVLFPVQEALKRHGTLRYLREMMVDQYRSPEQLLSLQAQRLREHLARAACDVPYYQDVFRSLRCTAEDFLSTADLAQLPFLTKDMIRAQGDQLRSSRARRGIMFTTGGSTGVPLSFFLGNTRIASDVAARCRAEGWFGVGLGDPEFVIWGAPAELSRQDRWRSWRDRLMRTQLFSAFAMSEPIMDDYLAVMMRRGCRRVFGYPSSIAFLATHAQRRGIDLRELGARAVFVTGETLWDEWRKTIVGAFGCPVGNGYGGRDSGFIAHECPAGNLHLTADRIITEVVSEKGTPVPLGSLGEIVVTHLDTPELPLVRYRTGDMGVLSAQPCTCGITLPVLASVEGRKTDFIIAADGRVMHGLSVIYILREVPGVVQFRITQHKVDDFEVEIVRGAHFSASAEERIRHGFRQRLNSPVSIAFRYLDAIPPAASGKFRYVVSEVCMPDGVAQVAKVLPT